MSVPSIDTDLYFHIQTGSYKYPHHKILLGNEGCDNLSLYTVFYLDGSMSSAIGVEQRQGDQLQLFSFLMYCLCIAGDYCCNPYIKKEVEVEEHDNEHYEIMTIRVK